MVWHPVIALVFALRLMLGLVVQPQLQPAMLTVSLRDVSGSGVVGVSVVVRDTSGAQEYSRGLTDANGQVQFAAVPTPDVRVALEGSLADGTPLILRGDDAQGIRYTITAEQVTMYLRADVDGSVLPDPEQSVALEHGGGDITDLPPEAPVAMVVVAPTAGLVAPTAVALAIATPVAVLQSVAPEPAMPWWQLVLVIGVVTILGGGAAALLLMRERV